MTDEPEKPKKSGRGGARPGAGRKPGVPNLVARHHIRRIEAGLERDPWQHFARIMHWWGQRAERLEKLIAEKEAKGELVGEGSGLDALRRAHEKVMDAAKELMPYLRPKLSALKITGGIRLDPELMTPEERDVVRRIIERHNSSDAGRNDGDGDTTRH